jgi:hypothetical protein
MASVVRGLMVLLALMAIGGEATACGSVRIWSEAYARATSAAAQRTALQELAAMCPSKAEPDDHKRIASVLQDAVSRGHETALLRGIFEAYDCLADVEDAARSGLRERLGAKCPS